MARKMKDFEVGTAATSAPAPEVQQGNDEPVVATVPIPARGPTRARARHYLQRLDEAEALIWARRCIVNGQQVEVGDVFDRTAFNAHKVRMFWNSGYIQAKDWDPVTARRTRGTRRRRVG